MSILKLATEIGEFEKEIIVLLCSKRVFKDEKGVERTSYSVIATSKAPIIGYEDGQRKILGTRDVELKISSEFEIQKGIQKVVLIFSEHKDKKTEEPKLSLKLLGLVASGSTTKKAI